MAPSAGGIVHVHRMPVTAQNSQPLGCAKPRLGTKFNANGCPEMLKINRPIPGNRVRLLVFDLDGTLVDSRLDLANSVNAMLRRFERPELPVEVIATYIGDGAPMLVRRALGDPDGEAYGSEAIQ